MKKLVKLLFFLSLVLFWNSVLAQDPKFQKVIGFSYETGPLLSNGTDWGDEIKDAVDYRAIDFKLGWKKISNTPYNFLYRYPTLGFGFNSFGFSMISDALILALFFFSTFNTGFNTLIFS